MNLDGVRRIGIDARGMQPRSTGLGNYIKNVLVPMAAANPSVDFFLYSNIPLEAPAGINIHLRHSFCPLACNQRRSPSQPSRPRVPLTCGL